MRWLLGFIAGVEIVLVFWLCRPEYFAWKSDPHREEVRRMSQRITLEECKHKRYVKREDGTRGWAPIHTVPIGFLFPDGAIRMRFEPLNWKYPEKWKGAREVQLPDGSWKMPDGAIILPDGTLKDTPEAYVPEEPTLEELAAPPEPKPAVW